MDELTRPLLANCVFSLATGALLAISPATVSDWLGVDIPVELRLFGLVLIGHAAALFWVARREEPRPLVMLNLLAIAPYPIAMIGLVAFGVLDTNLGRTLALADGFVIAVIAAWHAASLRRKTVRTTLTVQ